MTISKHGIFVSARFPKTNCPEPPKLNEYPAVQDIAGPSYDLEDTV